MQEVWNSANGQQFDLNENGDLTKLEFEAALIQQDIDRHAYWEEGGAGDTFAKPLPVVKTLRFKQVRTFSGGFRLVEVSNDETPRHGKEVKSIPVNRSPTKPTAASSPSESQQEEPQNQKPKRGGFLKAGLFRDAALR